MCASQQLQQWPWHNNRRELPPRETRMCKVTLAVDATNADSAGEKLPTAP